MASINANIVVQSSLALITAMLVTDAVRDGIVAYGISVQHMLELKIIVAIVVLLITLFIIWRGSSTEELTMQNTRIVSTHIDPYTE